MFRTRKEAEEKIKETMTWLAAAFIGIGVGLSLTVILLGWGMLFVLLGAVAGAAGLAVAHIYPRFLFYRPYRCPYCQYRNQVVPQVKDFECGGCGRTLRWANLVGKGAA